MNDIMKIVQALEDSNTLQKGVIGQLKMKQKNKKEDFWVLIGTLGASLLRNMLAGKGIVRAGSGNKEGKGVVMARYGKEWDF